MSGNPRSDAETLKELVASMPKFEAPHFELGQWVTSDPRNRA